MPTLLLHFVRGLPSANNDFTHAPHRLRIRRNHRKCAEVVQNVFGRNGFAADAAFGKRHVFGNRRRQVMADHQHVEVFVHRVNGVRACRIGGRWQDIRLPRRFNNIGGVSAARAFGVVGVDHAPFHRRQRVFKEAGFVERVGVDGDLHIHFIRHGQAVVDGGGGCAPIFMQFQTDSARCDLFAQGVGQADIAFAQETEVHG